MECVGKPTPGGRYTFATVPLAAIAFDFDPLLRVGDLVVRWQTVALAVVIVVCLAAAGVAARRLDLRADDLLYIAIGAVPGAVVGGRIGYAFMLPAAFPDGLISLADPTLGGLEAGLGVAGGLVTATIVAALIGAPLGRWANLLAVFVLAALVGGKLSMVLGGSGQGGPLEASWATAYLGAGPWGSMAADVPSHPAQLYEAIGTLAVALVVTLLTAARWFRVHDGRRLLIALAGWAVVRTVVSTTWRDSAVVGPLPAAGLIALAIAAGMLAGLVAVTVVVPRRQLRRAAAATPAWPDPESGPRF